MDNLLQLKKVLWRNGDVVSEEHFYALEEWIEQLVSMGYSQAGCYGLFRNSYLQTDYNNPENINFKRLDGANYQVEVSQFQGLSSYGKLIKIDDSRPFNFQFRPSQKNPDGKYLLYIMPLSSGRDGIVESDSEPTTGVSVYDALYEVSITNNQNTGVVLCRFKIEDNEFIVDKSFIPFGVFIDSSPMSVGARDGILTKFSLWSSLLDNYLKSLKPTPELALIWNATGQFIRANGFFKPLFENAHTPTLNYFSSLQQFFNQIKSELQILSVGWEQATLKQRINEVVEKLDESIISPNEVQVELNTAFSYAGKLFDDITKLLSYFPAGPIAEKTLPISRVELMKEAAGNRLNIYLETEAQFAKGKTQITFQLREFSKSDSVGKNIRVGMGSAIFAQLLDLKNLLKRVPGESFTYTIECPPEVVTKDKASQLTLFLPQPLGEGVIDLKSHLTIIIRD
jgi:hypothetical protein